LTGVKGSFDRVLRNIKTINSYKRKLGKKYPTLEFVVVLVKDNYMDIPDIITLAKNNSVNSVFIEPITVYSPIGKKLKLSKTKKKEFSKIAEKSKRIAEKFKISTNLGNFIDTKLIEETNSMHSIILNSRNGSSQFTDLACFEPFYRMGIRTDGVVCPCGFFDEGSKENIRDKSLNEIWFGDYFEKRRKEMIQKKLASYCSRCCTTLVLNNQSIREELNKFGNK
jgi:MoaA/NifB/PqqE/SkfB family radical SAM enzyme